MTKLISTPFKLTEDERNLLNCLGDGSMIKGLRSLLQNAETKGKESEPNGVLKILREFSSKEDSYTYYLFKGRKKLLTLSFTLDIHKSLINQMGLEEFYSSAVIHGLLPYENDKESSREEITRIQDIDSRRIIWKRE